MARRGESVGMILAIVFLALIAAVMAGLFFMQQVEFQEMKELLVRDSPEVLYKIRGNDNVGKLLTEVNDLEKEYNELFLKVLPEKEAALREITAKYKNEERRSAETDRLGRVMKTTVEVLDEAISRVRQQKDVILNRDDGDLLKDMERYNRLQTLATSLVTEYTRDKKALEQRETYVRNAALRRIQDIEAENAILRAAIERKEQAMRQRDMVAGEAYDGEIIEVDAPRRFLVVDLGRVHGMRRGMLFEVVRWQKNHWKEMGLVEVTQVQETTSHCILLKEEKKAQRLCEVCGYVGECLEEKFCPYCSKGENRDEVVPLVIFRKEIIETLDLNPILKGDKIRNPLFHKRGPLHFALVGDPVVFSPERIKKKLAIYGGIIDEHVGVQTDYVIFGRTLSDALLNAGDEERTRYRNYLRELDRIQLYGVPIVYETQLLNFLR